MTNVVKTHFFPLATLRWNQSTCSPRAPSAARQCFNALAASARRRVRRPGESSWHMALKCWMSHSCKVTLIADLFHRLKAATPATSATECKTCTASREILKGPVSGVSKDCNVSFKIAKKIVLGQIDWRLYAALLSIDSCVFHWSKHFIHSVFQVFMHSFLHFSMCFFSNSAIQSFSQSVAQWFINRSLVLSFYTHTYTRGSYSELNITKYFTWSVWVKGKGQTCLMPSVLATERDRWFCFYFTGLISGNLSQISDFTHLYIRTDLGKKNWDSENVVLYRYTPCDHFKE